MKGNSCMCFMCEGTNDYYIDENGKISDVNDGESTIRFVTEVINSKSEVK